MSQTIKLKRSALTGKVPTTGNIDLGELAINTTDGKIFFKKDDGTETIQTILTTNAEITGALYLSGSLTASSALIGPLTFPITDGSAGQFLKTDGAGTIGYADGVTFPYTGSAIISSSLQVTGSFSVAGSTTTTTLSSSYIDLDVLANGDVPPHKEGRIFYGAGDGALQVYNDEADITLQVGQEFFVRAYNATTSSILNGTPVRISGSQGDRPKIYPALAEDHTAGSGGFLFENHIIGIATHDIGASSEGYVTAQGIVRGVDTTKFSAGDVLFLQTGSSATPSDYYRNTPPPFPYDVVVAGIVARSAVNGFIFVEPIEPTHFANISGLSGSYTPSVGDLWVYQSNNAWTHTNVVPNLIATGSFTGSFSGDGSGLTGVGGIFTVSGSDVDNNQFDSEISVLQFDSSTGLNVSQSAAGTALISIGSHYRDIVINGQTTLVATGSDQLEFISGDGITLTTSMTDTNANSVSKEINFSIDNTVLRTTGDNVVSSSVQVDVTQTTNYDEVVNISGSQTILGVKTFEANNVFNGLQTFNNITVNGTGSFNYIESITGSAKLIGDAYIVVNNSTPAERYAGIKVFDSGSANVTASLEFDGQTNDWFYEYSDDGGVTTDHGVVIFGPEYNIKGSPTYLTNNTIPKSIGSHHLNDSNITDNGTLITLGSNTSITGTVVATGTTLVSSSAQIATDISGAFTSTSSSIATQISSLQTASGSFSTRVSTNESNISTNQSNISGLQTASGSFSTRVTSNETNISNLQTDSGSFSTRVTQNESDISTNQTDISNLQIDSGSFSTRVTTNETNISNLQTASGSFSTRVTNTETSISTLEGKTLVSSSAQIDHDQTTNFSADEHFTQANITTVGTVTSGNVSAILPSGTVSSSAQIDHDQTTNFSADEHFTQANITTVGTVTSGDITGILPSGTVSGSSQINADSITNFDTNVKDKMNTDGVISSSIQVDHDQTTNYSADEHFTQANITTVGTVTSGNVTAILPAGTVSSSAQIDHDQTTNFSADEHFTQGNITTVGTVTSGDVSAILPSGTVSGSSQVSYTGLSNIPSGIVSGSSQVSYTGLSNIPSGIVSSSAQIDHDQTTNFSSDEHFTQANITTVGTVTSGNVTAILPSGTVSSSAQIDHDQTTNFSADEHFTQANITTVGTVTAGSVTAILPAGTVSGSSQVSYTGLSNIPSGIVSSSAEGDGQGQIKLNGVNVNTNGLGTDDSPQFTNLTLSGDLTVNGTTTTVNSTEVEIGDRIIVLNGQDAAGDSGINVYDTSTNQTGSLLWDTAGDYWKGGLLGSEVKFLRTTGDSIVSSSAQIDHDQTTNFSSDEHFTQANITTVGTVTTGNVTAILPSGVVSSSAQLESTFDTRYLNTIGDSVVSSSIQISHDSTTGFVSNEHIDHSTVSIVSGNGLTGGGTIATSRTMSVGAGDGISVAADSVAVDSTVVRTSGNQTIGGTKTFSSSGTIVGTLTLGNNTTTDGALTMWLAAAPDTATMGVENVAGSAGFTMDSRLKVTGDILATGEVTAFASDDRLKNRISILENPIEKVKKLEGFTYTWNEKAETLGLQNNGVKVGVSAQQVQAVLPEAVKPSPVSNEYLTVQYEKLVPLLIESIKEQQNQIEKLQDEIEQLRNDVTR